ncbi:hypothetical protein [Candidatus Endoriftia persephone]|nr:hypothetical protein [Candidatus Endoriftia persephone]USF88763.1 hypothetical protein L0Y14_05890 [Candidatus Endoriftia persephone]
MDLPQQLYNEAFGPGVYRTPRSRAYEEGVMSALVYRFNGERMSRPYEVGTAEADAWFAGTREGHRRWRDWQEKQAAAA